MPTAQRVIQVQVVQPVVPHYRRPLFDALARLPDLDLHIDASAAAPGSPPSIACAEAAVDLAHPCLELLPGRLFWQRGLQLRAGLGRGDVLVVGGNPRYLSNLPLITAARRRGIAVAWWGQGRGATSTALGTALRVRLMRRADVLMLYTEREVEEFAAHGFERERLFGLNNALDQEPIEAARARWPADRLLGFQREHDLCDRPLLLFCGRLRTDPRTDLEVALQALTVVAQRHPRCQLAIIGSGPDEARLRAACRSLGVDTRVRWLGEIRGEAALAPWFLSASALVYPGSIGLSLLHAFGYGLPVITHDRLRQHGPEIAALAPGINGLLHARGDAQALAGCVHALLASRDLRRLMSAAALHTVISRYTMPGMVNRFHAAIHAAAALSAAPATNPGACDVSHAHHSLR
jgi:glycosyltransferase involved in cell wall biosynthesis